MDDVRDPEYHDRHIDDDDEWDVDDPVTSAPSRRGMTVFLGAPTARDATICRARRETWRAQPTDEFARGSSLWTRRHAAKNPAQPLGVAPRRRSCRTTWG